MAEKKEYIRFAVSQIIEHWATALSFIALAVTGLPQKFVGDGWAESMIAAMGGIETVRIIHHTAAIVMVLAAVYHVIAVAYKIIVLRVRWTMLPGWSDAVEAWDAVRYNLGLTKHHAKHDHFNFGEKAEYWALVWGTVIMALTGFIMWNPIGAARIMPGEVIPASKAAHGAEAILAVLAIIVWHFYNVHLKTLNLTVFTGKLSAEQMKEEHALELERLAKGDVDKRPAPEVVKKRESIFIPVATLAGAAMLIGVFLLTTGETTAITTQPKRATVVVFLPITATPTVPVPTATPKPVTTAASGTIQAGGTPAAAGATNGLPNPIPADHAGRTNCMACHAVLDPKAPADHAGRADSTCSACHAAASTAATTAPTQAGAAVTAAATKASTAVTATTSATIAATKASTTVTATTSATAAAATTGLPKPIPADHAGRTNCMACHAVLDPKAPADHAGRADATCSGCHAAASTTAAGTSTTVATTAATTAATKAATSAATTAATKAATSAATTAATTAATKAATSAATTAATTAATKAATTAATMAATKVASDGLPNPIPADHVGRTNCMACHAILDPKAPADHAGRADSLCPACHASASAATAATPTTAAAAGARTSGTAAATSAATTAATKASTTVTATTAATATKASTTVTATMAATATKASTTVTATTAATATMASTTVTATTAATATKASTTVTATTSPTASATTTASGPTVCLACHGGSFDKLVASGAIFKTDAGETVNPHRYVPHDSTDASAVPDCTNCHEAHPLVAKPVVDLTKVNVDYCFNTCHHQYNFTPCKTCHQ